MIAERIASILATPPRQLAPVTPPSTPPTAVSDAMAKIATAVRRFSECAEDGEDCDIGRPMFDCLTTLGLLGKAGRNRWEVTDAGESVAAISPAAPDARGVNCG